MTKLKLLITADTYYPKKDGVVTFLKEIVSRLSKDFEITLIVPNFNHKNIETEKGKITIVKLPVSRIISLAGYHAVKYNLKNRKTIKKYIQETDYIFVQDLAPLGSWSIKYAREMKKPIIAYIHQINWEQLPQLLPKITRYFTKKIVKNKSLKAYNQCDLIIVPYQTLGRELKEAGLKIKTKVVKLGINTELFKPSEDKDHSKEKIKINPAYTVVGYVGRISDEKNLTVLLESFKRLQEEYKLYLLIVGGGSEKTIKEIENNKNVKVTGFVSDVVPYLQAMDIFVMPSLTETTSLATLEAMSCGIPVITTKVGFLKEYVIKNYNGLLFPKGNTFTLNIQLKKLLENVKLRKTLGKHAQTTAHSFSWDKTTEEIKTILEKI